MRLIALFSLLLCLVCSSIHAHIGHVPKNENPRPDRFMGTGVRSKGDGTLHGNGKQPASPFVLRTCEFAHDMTLCSLNHSLKLGIIHMGRYREGVFNCHRNVCLEPGINTISVYWSPMQSPMLDDYALITGAVHVRYRKFERDPLQVGVGWRAAHFALPDVLLDGARGQRGDSASGTNGDNVEWYRSSIEHLEADTEYEVLVRHLGTNMTSVSRVITLTDNYVVGRIINVLDSRQPLYVDVSGSPRAYVVYQPSCWEGRSDGDCTATIDVDSVWKWNVRFKPGVNYVVVRGLTLRGASANAIALSDADDWQQSARHLKRPPSHKHLFIEDCDISGWGQSARNNSHIGPFAGIYALGQSVQHLVIRRNIIHHPATSATRWRYDEQPRGPYGIMLQNTGGHHVIRYNTFYSDFEHAFGVILGQLPDDEVYDGFPGRDSVIESNYMSHCFDTAVVITGNGMNVRVVRNYVEHAYQGFSSYGVTVGPLFFIRNVMSSSWGSAKVDSDDDENWQRGSMFRVGTDMQAIRLRGGAHQYIYHNTMLQPTPRGKRLPIGAAHGVSSERYGPVVRVSTANNVFVSYDANVPSIYLPRVVDHNLKQFDHWRWPVLSKFSANRLSRDLASPLAATECYDNSKDLCEPNRFREFPAQFEYNWMHDQQYEGTPMIWGFRESLSGKNIPAMLMVMLSNTSVGIDAGQLIPGVNEAGGNFAGAHYHGKAPDLGAQEHGSEEFPTQPMQFGHNAFRKHLPTDWQQYLPVPDVADSERLPKQKTVIRDPPRFHEKPVLERKVDVSEQSDDERHDSDAALDVNAIAQMEVDLESTYENDDEVVELSNEDDYDDSVDLKERPKSGVSAYRKMIADRIAKAKALAAELMKAEASDSAKIHHHHHHSSSKHKKNGTDAALSSVLPITVQTVSVGSSSGSRVLWWTLVLLVLLSACLTFRLWTQRNNDQHYVGLAKTLV